LVIAVMSGSLVALAISASLATASAYSIQGVSSRAISSRVVSSRATRPMASAIEATEACAQQQREEYFRLMPSKELPKVSLDLRAFRSTANDAVEAGIFARQQGTVVAWENIGVVATTDTKLFSEAVSKQRVLIERWAYEVCNDFETNKLRMVLEGGPPIELAWAIEPAKPSFMDSLMGKLEDAPIFHEVERDVGFDVEVQCGFLGTLAREYRGGGVSARYERIVIGKEPEVPLRDPRQAKFDEKYQKKGRIQV